jgi:hypothetical protein
LHSREESCVARAKRKANQAFHCSKVVESMTLPTPDLSAWLVATKLSPPLMRGEIIRRGQLEEALSRSVSTLPVTLLSAPAGYGKTTLLATLPHLLPDLPLAWVTLDAEDNDPGRFAGLLAAALQRLHPACGRSVWPWLTAGGADPSTLKQAMGDKAGLARYGLAVVPLDEALAEVVVDLSGRPHLTFNAGFPSGKRFIGTYDVDLTQDFFQAFCNHARICLHVNVRYGRNLHHVVEAIFKATARALRAALQREGTALPSTKGLL